jgi:hypothetical protein
MAELCMSPECGLETDQLCAKCRRPFCDDCAKFGMCYHCLVPRPVSNKRNRLSRGRKRKRVEHDEPVTDTNQQFDQQESLDTPPASLPVQTTQVQQETARKNVTECDKCGENVFSLRRHLQACSVCANYYREQFGIENINDIADKVINEKRNRNRMNRRREDAANGNFRDRTIEIEQRRQSTHEDSMSEHYQNLYNLLVVPCIFCGCRFNRESGIKKLSADDTELGILLDSDNERGNKYMFENSLWKCNNCELISKRLNGNQSLVELFATLLKKYENETSETVLVMSYDDCEQLNKVYLPRIHGQTDIGVSDSDKPVKAFTAMLPTNLCRLSKEGDIEPEVAQFLVNKTEIDTEILLAALYKDTDKKMQSLEKQIEFNKLNTMAGSVTNGIVHLDELRNQQEYHLRNMRCSDAYKKQFVKENLAKQSFNGHQSLKVEMEMDILTFGLNKILLNELNIPVKVSLENTPEGLHIPKEIVPCEIDVDTYCDVDNCDRVHSSARDKLDEKLHGAIPISVLPIVCRFLKHHIDSFVNKVLTKHTDYYHLYLDIDMDDTVVLKGNLWLKELADFNKRNETVTDSSAIPEFFTEFCGFELVTEKKELELFSDFNKFSDKTSSHIDMDDWKAVREGSLLDMITSTGRGLKSVWSNQSVVYINIGDATQMKHMFKKKVQGEDDEEEVFNDGQEKQWTMILVCRRKFVLKPEPLKNVTLAQFGGYYRKPYTKSNIDFDDLKQRLRANNGVLEESDVTIHTNLLKFPNELITLPKWILLNNGKIMQLRQYPAVIIPTGRLDMYGMRVLCEPFVNEQELIEEQRDNTALPNINTLEQRLKDIYPTSTFDVII